MTDLREQKLSQAVRSLLVMEERIAVSLNAVDESVRPDGYVDTIAVHRQALLDYLREVEGGDRVALTGVAPVADTAPFSAGASIAGPLSAAVTALYGLLSYATMRYAALFEMSLKLFDPTLRDLAPRHLNAHKGGAYALAANLAEVVAGELACDGLECQCVCPMCSLGACGCVSMGHGAALSPLASPDLVQAEPGFRLESPRTGSQLADAGVVAGDRLLAIDDQPVTTLFDIQTGIRKHSLGETLQLLIAHGDSTRRVQVTHVSDY